MATLHLARVQVRKRVRDVGDVHAADFGEYGILGVRVGGGMLGVIPVVGWTDMLLACAESFEVREMQSLVGTNVRLWMGGGGMGLLTCM